MADFGDALANMLAQGIQGYNTGSLERRKVMREREEKQKALEFELLKEIQKENIKRAMAKKTMEESMALLQNQLGTQAGTQAGSQVGTQGTRSPVRFTGINPSTGELKVDIIQPKQIAEEEAISRQPSLGKALGYIQSSAEHGAPIGVQSEAFRRFSSPEELKQIKEVYKTGRTEYKTKKKEFLKKQETQQKEQDIYNKAADTAREMLSVIGDVEKDIKYFGRYGNLPTGLTPGTLPLEFIDKGFEKRYGERQAWESNVARLLGLKWLETIKELKAQSRTGASGLGSLTEKEGKRLEAAATALSRATSPEQAQKYLNEMKAPLMKLLAGARSRTNGAIIPQQQESLPQEIPSVGSTFGGGKVIKVTRIQ